MTYELHYWPTIQGRGEFVRLALEEAGAAYVDVARLPAADGGGEAALLGLIGDRGLAHPPFAPPILKVGDRLIAQTPAILLFLGGRHGLAPADDDGRLWAHQLQLTLSDWLDEAHDTHHPICSSLYYEDQAAEARRRAGQFLRVRLPKYLGYVERVLAQNPAGDRHLVGAGVSYCDLSLFQMIEGLRYAFPNAMARSEAAVPRVMALHGRVAERPRIAAYLASPRRIPFNEEGIFRRYPELDP